MRMSADNSVRGGADELLGFFDVPKVDLQRKRWDELYEDVTMTLASLTNEAGLRGFSFTRFVRRETDKGALRFEIYGKKINNVIVAPDHWLVEGDEKN